ncbi:hypothetical protein BDZ85DRAFT_262583 [Elsinoe ampelina]|uniref:Uncharacterized protein n=1 Tax=Elsinoe ampelina TaxID=302913 RepID=A0A6A6GAY0_9PEZI|nr:hypothetical protein BDZ85DRAFT_262583 [Elsinoe ampelina]
MRKWCRSPARFCSGSKRARTWSRRTPPLVGRTGLRRTGWWRIGSRRTGWWRTGWCMCCPNRWGWSARRSGRFQRQWRGGMRRSLCRLGGCRSRG